MLKWNDVLRYGNDANPRPDHRVEKTDAAWKQLLSPEEYAVTRHAGTERAFSSEMCSLFEPGIYACRCCDTVLFDAQQKFESGTGWPSFTAPLTEEALEEIEDHTYGMVRTEVRCGRCGGHLGHVFPDGPAPTGLRYCMNSVAMRHVPEGSPVELVKA
jgi:peptide-methionine (R)-S-oxide reductase